MHEIREPAAFDKPETIAGMRATKMGMINKANNSRIKFPAVPPEKYPSGLAIQSCLQLTLQTMLNSRHR